MKTRQATLWDALDITKLWLNMADEVPKMMDKEPDAENFMIMLMKWIKDPDGRVLVAVDNEKIIAFMLSYAQYEQYSKTKIYGFCEAIYVEKAYRGQKIDERLIDESIGEGKLLGMTSMEFITDYNPRLVDVWQRKGYEATKIIFRKEIS